MSPEQIEAIVQKAAQAWMDGDAASFSQLFLPNGLFIVPGRRWQGREAIRQSLSEFAANHSDVEIEIRRILIAGDSAVVEWLWQETAKETGQHTIAEDAIVVDFVDGQIESWREYIDLKSPVS